MSAAHLEAVDSLQVNGVAFIWQALPSTETIKCTSMGDKMACATGACMVWSRPGAWGVAAWGWLDASRPVQHHGGACGLVRVSSGFTTSLHDCAA